MLNVKLQGVRLRRLEEPSYSSASKPLPLEKTLNEICLNLSYLCGICPRIGSSFSADTCFTIIFSAPASLAKDTEGGEGLLAAPSSVESETPSDTLLALISCFIFGKQSIVADGTIEEQ